MKNRVLYVLLSMIMILGLCISFGIDSTYAKTNIRLNKKTAYIMETKTAKLKIVGTKKKVRWISKKKSVATVSKKGVVKGKKAGKTTIVASVGGKKYICKVYVRKYFEINLTTKLPKTFNCEYLIGDNFQYLPTITLNNIKLDYKYKKGFYYVDVKYNVKRVEKNIAYNESEGYSLPYNYQLPSYVHYKKTNEMWEGTVDFYVWDLKVGETRQGTIKIDNPFKPGKYKLEFDEDNCSMWMSYW